MDDEPAGDNSEALFAVVYQELRQLAAARLQKETPGQTLSHRRPCVAVSTHDDDRIGGAALAANPFFHQRQLWLAPFR